MEETGTVIRIGEHVAYIKLDHAESAGCGHCPMSGCCGGTEGPGVIQTEATGLSVGGRVLIHMDLPSPLKASVLLYVIPLIAFFLGYISGALIGGRLWGEGRRELAGILGAFVLMFAAFVLVGAIDRMRSGAAEPVITAEPLTGES